MIVDIPVVKLEDLRLAYKAYLKDHETLVDDVLDGMCPPWPKNMDSDEALDNLTEICRLLQFQIDYIDLPLYCTFDETLSGYSMVYSSRKRIHLANLEAIEMREADPVARIAKLVGQVNAYIPGIEIFADGSGRITTGGSMETDDIDQFHGWDELLEAVKRRTS